MTKEKISVEFAIFVRRTTQINPAIVSIEGLVNSGVIDSKDEIDDNLLRISSLGTSIRIPNKGDIDVSTRKLTFKFLNEVDIIKMYNYIRDIYSGVEIDRFEYSVDYHFRPKKAVESFFTEFYGEQEFSLKAIQLAYKNIFTQMYSCQKDVIHITFQDKSLLSSSFDRFSVESYFASNNMDEVVNLFFSKKIFSYE